MSHESAEPPSPPPSRKWFGLLTGDLPLQDETTYFILANALDIFLTYMLLRFGGIEANPFANAVLVRWGFWGMIGFKLAIVAAVCLIAQVIALSRPATARVLLWGGTLAVAAVVVYSMLLYSLHTAHLTPEF